MKHNYIDLEIRPLGSQEFETMAAKNLVKVLDEEEHALFISRQLGLANNWLSEGKNDWHNALMKRIDLFLQACVEKGIDVSQFLPSQDTEE
jgi:hypothetical protein